jgi:hypothetical protein
MEITIKANQMASWIEYPVDTMRLGNYVSMIDASGTHYWTVDHETWHVGAEIVATGTVHAQAVL